MRLHRRGGRRAPGARPFAMAPAVAAAAVVAVVAGCSTTQAGSAATVGGTSITEGALQSQVTAYLDSLPAAQRAQKKSSMAQVQAAILASMVDEAVVTQVATAQGITVTPAQVAARVQTDVAGAGGQLDSELASLYLTRATLPAFERTNLQFLALRKPAGAATLSDADAQAKVFTYVVARARELPVRLSPRYGMWNSSKLSLSGGVQSISTPAA